MITNKNAGTKKITPMVIKCTTTTTQVREKLFSPAAYSGFTTNMILKL
jgi:hypothetical protein